MKKRVFALITTFILIVCTNSVYAKGFMRSKKPAPIPPTKNQFTMDDYLKDVEKKIKANWIPPETNFKNKTIVNFQVLRDGTIMNSKISQTSGDAEFDKGAMLALHSTGKLAPLPNNVLGNSVDINFTFERFSYLVKKDRYDR